MHTPGTILVVIAVTTVLCGCAPFQKRGSVLNTASGTQPEHVSAGRLATADASPPQVSDADASEPATNSVSPHDSATQLLIATELRDATPEERTQWMSHLNALPSSQIAMALRDRRSGATPTGAAPAVKSESRQFEHQLMTADASDADSPQPEPPQIVPATAEQEKKKSLSASLFPRIGLPQILPDRGGNAEVSDSAPSVVETPAAVHPEPEKPISPGAALWEDEIRKLITLIEADTASLGQGVDEDRLYLKRQVALRMLHLIANDVQEAQRVIPQLPPTEQEFWTNTFLGLNTYLGQSELDDSARRSQAIAQLRTALHHLEIAAPLQLRNLAFCSRIDGFGTYEEFPSHVFSPNTAVLLYTEVRNFHSEPNIAGFYETRLHCNVEIIQQGEDLVVDQHDFETTTDSCRVLRQDYYQSFRIDLPQLTAGNYELRLRVKDEFTGKVTRSTLPFAIR